MFFIRLRNVDPSYLRFLRAFDPHIPTKDMRLWLYPVNVNGIDYGIPLTSKAALSGYPGYLRFSADPDSGLYLRYMVPLPLNALLPNEPLTEDLNHELRYYEENRKYIEAEAQILRQLSSAKQMDRYFMSQSCDFEELESVYSYWQPGFEAGHFLDLNREEEQAMPISKNGIAYFTKDQLQAAKAQTNALEYAKAQGYELIKENTYYRMKDHNSLVFYPNGTFIWNSRGVSGGILEFMIHYENKNLVDAVLSLVGDKEYLKRKPAAQKAHDNIPESTQEEPVERPERIFRAPAKDDNNKQMYYYLCQVRGLEKPVVAEMVRQGVLYQSAYRRRDDDKVLTNTTFLYKDYEGKPVGAFQRGMVDIPGIPSYKREYYGTNKNYGWLLRGSGAVDTVLVFEGAIDAASDASLAAMKGGEWRDVDRLSMEGVSNKGLWILPLRNYLQAHPNTRNVVLMFDADTTGRVAAASTEKWLRETYPELRVIDRLPPFGKDWNEVLTDTRIIEEEQRELASPEQTEPQTGAHDYEQEI